jgi:hypothetical protein
MGEACSVHARNEKCIQNFELKSLRGEDHSEDRAVDGSIVFK